jgi:hypothetical protein
MADAAKSVGGMGLVHGRVTFLDELASSAAILHTFLSTCEGVPLSFGPGLNPHDEQYGDDSK